MSSVSEITNQMKDPHVLNKLGFRLGFLGRLTDLVNTVAFEISLCQRKPDSSELAKWECSIAEAHAIVQYIGDRKLCICFSAFKRACEKLIMDGKWSEGTKREMRENQTELLTNTHRLQSKKLCEYVWTGLILLTILHLIFPLILHHITG